MINDSDFFGSSIPTLEFGNKRESMPDFGFLNTTLNKFELAKNYEKISSYNDVMTEKLEEDATKSIYSSSADIIINKTITSTTSFLGIKANSIKFTNDNISLEASATGHHFSGGSTNKTPTMLSNFPFALRGGDGYGSEESVAGGDWFAGSGRYSSNYWEYGGGCIFLIADIITGSATLNVKGNLHGTSSSHYHRESGGGTILILTKSWEANITLNVLGANNGAGVREGSYAIFKIEDDNSLTLMVHSKQGESADLWGQTPIHGTDASIAW